MIQHSAGTFAVEIKISMVRKIHHGRRIGLCGKGQCQFVFFGPLIMSDDFQVSGISGFPILREIHEFYGISLYPAVPHLILESVRTSVKMIASIVYRQCIFFSVESEMSLCNSVRISSRAFSCTRSVSEI